MIRVSKNEQAPQSLSTTKAYDGEDVKHQLFDDQHSKCYICERSLITDFEIEQHKSEKNYPKLVQQWTNLLLSCRYCNGKKLDNYDNLLDPLTVNIEDEIKQELDFVNNTASFTPLKISPAHIATIKLLNSVFNGIGKLRRFKEEKFFEYTVSVINRFLVLVNAFLANQSKITEKAVRDELSIDREYLGFKYWIVKSNPILDSTFARDIKWNK